MKTLKNKTRLLIIFMAGALSSVAWSAGEIVAIGGSPHVYRLNLGNGELSNVVGSTIVKPFDRGVGEAGYDAQILCARQGQTYNGPVNYRAVTSLMPSDILANSADGYLKLNEYIDVKVEIYMGGGVRKDVVIPYPDLSNEGAGGWTWPGFMCNYPGTPPTGRAKFNTGSKGTVTFKLRKPIINGIDVNMREIVSLYGRMGASSIFGGVPMAQVVIETSMLTVPDKCVVNNQKAIEVDFKDIPQTSLDGSKFIEPIPVSYSCTGGSFDAGVAKGIKLGLSARPAAFNSDYIDTTSNNLGVVVKHDGVVVKPNTFTPMPKGNTGTWNLTAAPITSGSDIPLGEFTASATIVMEFNEY
ncbi:MAG: fimbrial protein [Neisseriaceae bacterium]|nr:fimbrial protein [Neisseriaceae bacterium]